MRLALMVEQEFFNLKWRRHALIAAIRREFPNYALFPVRNNYAEVAGRLADRRAEFQCVLTFLYFRKMCRHSDALRSMRLPIVMIEHDAHFNFNPAHPIRGKLSAFLSKCPVEVLAVSGRRACELIAADGHECMYLPKAAPAAFLAQPNRHTGFFCVFGSFKHPVYAQRAKLFEQIKPRRPLDILARAFPTTMARLQQRLATRNDAFMVHRLHFRFSQMADVLANYAGCVICDKGLQEPMAKHFEVSALGLVPFRDNEVVDELSDLGYQDGQSMIVYENVADLCEKLDYYNRHKDKLISIQEGARIASLDNTWENRARALKQYMSKRF